MNEDPLPTEVTIDQGNLIRGVIKSWDKNLLNDDHLMHDNWVCVFQDKDAAEVYSPEEH